MSKEIVSVNAIETALIDGDLSVLSPEQRLTYYKQVCSSMGLNPLTKPFDYIRLNGKLTLYARKDAADQLRKINNISIDPPKIEYVDDWIIVTVTAKAPDGRTDSEIGVVNRKDMQGNFGNALMKAVTKAKRRVTLSICGLGWLDETEVETIPGAEPVSDAVQGTAQAPEIKVIEKPAASSNSRPLSPEQVKANIAKIAAKGGEVSDDVKHAVIACLDFETMDTAKRNGVIRFLTGHGMEELTDGEYIALQRWLKPEPNAEGVFACTDSMSRRELLEILATVYPEGSE